MSPLERAARALADNPVNWLDYVPQARAAIEAIREPSEIMQVAGVNAPNYLEDQSSRRGCTNIYAAMIDALLEEGA